MTDYESMGEMKISRESGLEKYARGKKLEQKLNFVGLKAIFNVFITSAALTLRY